MQHCGKCPDAVAQIHGGIDAPQLSGYVQFYQESGCVLVVAKISGLPMESETGFYGFHIHQGESCEGDDFAETKGHYNSENCPHPYHSGDLPPLFSNDGYAFEATLTNRFDISEIIGKTVVIHSKSDDFKTQPSGDAGDKIACGVIFQIA